MEPKNEASVGRNRVQAVETAGTILRALAAGGGVMTLTELAAASGIGRAKVHRYLQSLKQTGLVTQASPNGRYRIGPTAITVGLVGLGSLNPVRQIYDALPELRDRLRETVTMAIWGEVGPTIIAMEEAGRTVTMNVRMGSVLPLFGSAIGRTFAAFMPAATLEQHLEGETARGSSAAELRERLIEVRHRRLERDEGQLVRGVQAIAAPVFDYRGKIAAVVCVIGRDEELDTSWTGKPARLLSETTADLSRGLGFVPMPDGRA